MVKFCRLQRLSFISLFYCNTVNFNLDILGNDNIICLLIKTNIRQYFLLIYSEYQKIKNCNHLQKVISRTFMKQI